jgi:glycerophosphoryl diester phosphodiesterase
VHPRPSRPIGFAHRGARAERPENTLAAFSRALELGATGLESDAWITADGQVVLDHDGTTGGPWRRRPIATQPRRALARHIPALAELYATCGTAFELSLDVKDEAAVPGILALAEQAGAATRLWLCHDNWATLAGWRTAAGAAKLVLSSRLDVRRVALAEQVRAWKQAGVDTVNLHRRQWTPDRVAAVHGAGMAAFGWDAQARTEIAGLIGMGVDGVYSDHVDRLMAVIAALSG